MNRGDHITIRKAIIEDAIDIMPLYLELMNLHGEYLPSAFKAVKNIDIKEIEDEIKAYEYFYVCLNDKKIIGYMKGIYKEIKESDILLYRNMITILDLIIEKEYRNNRIGKEMLKFIEVIAKDKGISSIEIRVYAFNRQANVFYNKNGYETYVERKVKIIN